MSSPQRPSGVTTFCTLAIIGALWDLGSAQWYYFDTDALAANWIAAHRPEALVQLGVKYFYATVALLTCYWMLRAKDWARWTYLSVVALQYTVAFALLGMTDVAQNYALFTFRGAMIPGFLLFLLALWVLFTRDARDYFHGGGRPWWKIEEEEEARQARRSRRK